MPDKITVVWGEETFFPVMATGFRMGPYSIETEVRPGETPEQAFKRAWDFLEAQALMMFAAKRNNFQARMKQVMEIHK